MYSLNQVTFTFLLTFSLINNLLCLGTIIVNGFNEGRISISGIEKGIKSSNNKTTTNKPDPINNSTTKKTKPIPKLPPSSTSTQPPSAPPQATVKDPPSHIPSSTSNPPPPVPSTSSSDLTRLRSKSIGNDPELSPSMVEATMKTRIR